MSIDLPYLNGYGYITKSLDKIITAQTPTRFTHDYLSTVLGITSSSARSIIPFFKRLGFLASDGSPTDIYTQFRIDSKRGHAAANALRNGYAALFEANEFANRLDDKGLVDLIIQVTGLAADSKSVKAIAGSFKAVREYADFDSSPDDSGSCIDSDHDDHTGGSSSAQSLDTSKNIDFGLSYTINLNLPATSDIAVFNAIFKSLKTNLLQ